VARAEDLRRRCSWLNEKMARAPGGGHSGESPRRRYWHRHAPALPAGTSSVDGKNNSDFGNCKAIRRHRRHAQTHIAFSVSSSFRSWCSAVSTSTVTCQRPRPACHDRPDFSRLCPPYMCSTYVNQFNKLRPHLPRSILLMRSVRDASCYREPWCNSHGRHESARPVSQITPAVVHRLSSYHRYPPPR